MTKEARTKRAFHEACVDTGLAAIISVPLNFVLVYLCIEVWNLGPIWTSVIMNIVFTTYAIWRKTYVRLHFDKKHNKHVDKPK